MPVIIRQQPKRESTEYEGSASWALENILARSGIGLMVGIVGFFIGFAWIGRTARAVSWWSGAHITPMQYSTQAAIAGAIIGFLIGFVLGDNLPEDWFTNLFGRRD
jgi:hypothetical protein